jgi:hypothetical protein
VRDAAPQIAIDAASDASVRKTLADAIGGRIGTPIELTVDQDVAMDAIREDLARPTPMLRLLQGDVGSGKTAVAAYALAATARAGLQGALLAPTDLLARQHLESVGALLAELGIGVTLLTGTLKADVKAKALEAIASGQALVVVGTHALIQEAVSFADLGLVVIDEQHRFGVDQRGALEAKAGGRSPHVLLMTATPIPGRSCTPTWTSRTCARLRPAASPSGPGSAGRRSSRGPGRRSARKPRSGTARSSSCRSSRRAPMTAMAPLPPRARPSGWPRSLIRCESAWSTVASSPSSATRR